MAGLEQFNLHGVGAVSGFGALGCGVGLGRAVANGMPEWGWWGVGVLNAEGREIAEGELGVGEFAENRTLTRGGWLGRWFWFRVVTSGGGMFGKILVLFVAVPLVELFLLLRLATVMGVFSTVALVVVTGLVGSFLARREGMLVWQRLRQSAGGGGSLTVELQNGLMVVFAAALLLTPGVLTDLVGFGLLTGVGRDWARRVVLPRLVGSLKDGMTIQVRSFGGGGFDAGGFSAGGEVRADTRREDPMVIDAEPRVDRR